MSGRGRLSTIELLGEDYDDIVAWAAGELRERKQLQVDILGEFNRRLAVRAEEIGDDDFKPVSKSSFGRYSVHLFQVTRELEETREIARAITERMQPGEEDDLTTLVSQMIKSAVLGALRDGERLPMEDVKFAAQALSQAVQARRGSADLRGKLEASIRTKVETAIEGAAAAAETAGETSKAELLRKIREDVYGLFER